MAILTTPLAIYHLCENYFPLISAEVAVDKDQLTSMKLFLDENEIFLELKTGIITGEFTKALKDYLRSREWCQINQKDSSSCQLQTHLFSTQIPLKGWKKFKRVVHEAKGNSCTQTIIEYLLNPDSLDRVSFLGLSPEQIDDNPDEQECFYFRTLPKEIKELSSNEKKKIFRNFQEKYPNLSKHIIEKLKERDLARGEREEKFPIVVAKLLSKIGGQDHAIEKMASAIVSQEKQDENVVCLFVGPSGVGKTETAKAIASLRENRLVTFSMNTFPTAQSVTTFFGSSSGFAGSTSQPHFAAAFEQVNPQKIAVSDASEGYEVKNIVLLFDEFEKAHSTIKQSLLTIFDEGFCKFNYTNGGSSHSQNISAKYVFKNTIIIATSNLHQRPILEAFVQDQSIDEISHLFIKLNELPTSPSNFSQELLGRVNVIPFGPISKGENYQKILKLKVGAFLEEFKKEISCKEFCIEDEESVLINLEKRLYGEGIDLRRIDRFFSSDVKTAIYKEINTWGDIKTKKLMLNCDEEGLFIKGYFYIEEFDDYGDLKKPWIRF